MTTEDTYECGCPKERSVRWLPKLQKGMMIFWATSTAIAVTLTVLYNLGIKP